MKRLWLLRVFYVNKVCDNNDGIKSHNNNWIVVPGSALNPKHISSQLVVLHLLLFGLLVFNYYSAGVVSAQLNAPIQKMNDSLHSLAKSNLLIAAEPITYTNHGLMVNHSNQCMQI